MKKSLNIVFLIIIALILITVLAFWVTDTIIRPSTAVLLVLILTAAVIFKNIIAKKSEDKEPEK